MVDFFQDHRLLKSKKTVFNSLLRRARTPAKTDSVVLQAVLDVIQFHHGAKQQSKGWTPQNEGSCRSLQAGRETAVPRGQEPLPHLESYQLNLLRCCASSLGCPTTTGREKGALPMTDTAFCLWTRRWETLFEWILKILRKVIWTVSGAVYAC